MTGAVDDLRCAHKLAVGDPSRHVDPGAVLWGRIEHGRAQFLLATEVAEHRATSANVGNGQPRG
jgi:hypothetical protein